MLVSRKASCCAANAFSTGSKVIWLRSSLKITKCPKNALFAKRSRSQWVNISLFSFIFIFVIIFIFFLLEEGEGWHIGCNILQTVFYFAYFVYLINIFFFEKRWNKISFVRRMLSVTSYRVTYMILYSVTAKHWPKINLIG